MSIPGSLTPLFSPGSSAATGYHVSRSLRFNSADSAYLGPKTFGSPTSSIAWTWASWVKKTLITTSTDYRGIFECGAGSNYAYLDFSDNGIRYAAWCRNGTNCAIDHNNRLISARKYSEINCSYRVARAW